MSVEFTRFSLYKRRNGLYSILYYHHGHRRWKATNTTTKSEALAILAQFKELLGTGIPPVPLQEFVTRFLSFLESTYSRDTIDLYRRVLRRSSRLAWNLHLLEPTPKDKN